MYWLRFLPYLSLGLVTIACFLVSGFVKSEGLSSVLTSVASNGVFFFVAYLFYDVIRQKVLRKEQGYIHEHIKRQLSGCIFNYLYFIKKVIYGYNLDTNTIENILGIVKLEQRELKNHVANQSYLGFQIFKLTNEVRNLFDEISGDAIFLKFSSHLDSVNLLKISNNLQSLERIYRDPKNFTLCAEKGIEFKVIDGRCLNPDNDEKLLLIKTTAHESRFVVYDSGYFELPDHELLLNRYVLKIEAAEKVSNLMKASLMLMKPWLPNIGNVHGAERKFRIIRGFFNEKTDIANSKSNLYVADIIEAQKRI
ncbi:hypothetical protein [Vibrio cyclitrophicus]|uniref:hypothetical protein n=1 Tax=Vibrio cyclitrophicus TaxID=47951 RepID=UPI0007EECBDB|nr:hypothetical protein [Vibrio cyclitrophicus]OBT23454.1 hypothetical protein A9263_10310 [Vibrio cyclitrophicus]PMF42387.1 hypothetical protein BCV15_13395 [Vibrio cyclitrophicus]